MIIFFPFSFAYGIGISRFAMSHQPCIGLQIHANGTATTPTQKYNQVGMLD